MGGKRRRRAFPNRHVGRPSRKLATFLAATLLAVATLSGGAGSRELGLTPSHVFGLWTNINNNLIASSRVVSGDTALPAALGAMKAKKFSGKNPADVLGQLVIYREKLDQLLLAQNLPQTRKVIHDGDITTPSDVYLNSGHVLNAQVRWLIVNTGPEQAVSHFYTRHRFTGKTPSDVFAMVDLANRRMDRLLRESGI